MKFLRFGEKGREKTGVLTQAGKLHDISAHVPVLGGASLGVEALENVRSIDLEDTPVVDATVRRGACLADAPNFYAIGLNYRAHAAEIGAEPPKEPIVFSKSTSCIAGPTDPLALPRGSTKSDWEAELGVVIGRTANHVSERDALDHVAGYCAVNDLSERAFQLEMGGQWIKGKSAPGFGPIGPWFVTSDEVADPQNLALSMTLNGDVKQSSSTSDMIFSVAEIIAYMSRFMELKPGDLIATGTPPGVGMGQTPPRFLKPGDVMEVEVEGLGKQRTDVLPAS